MKQWLFFFAMVIGLATVEAASPFGVEATAQRSDGQTLVEVALKIPAGHFLYAEHLKVSTTGAQLAPLDPPRPVKIHDKFSGAEKAVFDRDVTLRYRAEPPPVKLDCAVEFQGCNDTMCFFPEKKIFHLVWTGLSAPRQEAQPQPSHNTASSATATEAWVGEASHFVVAASTAGYLDKTKFLAFLDSAAGPSAAKVTAVGEAFSWATVLILLVGGLLLNLTPCVLPMIPVNLAIIGAGARAGSPRRGFLLGGIYGLGMALTYGVLGLIVVLTGAKFGALNASPWFNAGIAVIFVVLALAMFDLIQVDFSRFQSNIGVPAQQRRGSLGIAFTMGLVAALLAGACVAPVVLTVLLLAGKLYSQGQPLGLLLPFVLGLGMALPWPLAGAGLSFLPKPGAWMTKVKYTFGLLILVLAGYYGLEAYRLFRPLAGGGNTPAREFAQQLAAARTDGKAVFIDFWATWCKNCHAMEATTFKDPEVQKRLAGFAVIKYQADQPNDAPAKAILDHYGAVGLPTYVILRPQ
ncbi:MAG: DUF255 domain-containing protein [Verrucomicrobia bacterium]|nr:MAG: DUF255 domain-containing protein [Verrucomicrobiota bacterium]